jgi:hypothetical protein
MMAAGGLAAVVVLTAWGPYSQSMVGTLSDKASNNSPPSVCLIALTFWLVGLSMLLRDRVSSWLQKPRPWAAVVAANSVIMTVFLWHLTAMLVTVLALYPLGFPQPEGGSGLWWATRPLWLAALVGALAVLVRVLARFEKQAGAKPAPSIRPARSVVAVALIVAALGGFAQYGFDITSRSDFVLAQPLVNTAVLACGAALLFARSNREERR